MNPMIQYQDVPVNVLPPIFANTTDELAHQIKVSRDIIVNSMLGCISLAIQDKVNVCRMGNLISPCSIYVLSIADSGERKTAIDNILMKPIEEMENISLEACKNE